MLYYIIQYKMSTGNKKNSLDH